MRLRCTILIGVVGLTLAFAGERRDRAASGVPTELSDQQAEQGRHGPGHSGHPLHAERQADLPAGHQLLRGPGGAEEFLRRDLDDLQRHGFNWVRVWATWGAFDQDISAVDAGGRPREPFLDKLKRLVAECDRRGLVVDVTLTRARETRRLGITEPRGTPAGRRDVVGALKEHRNWYLDLANERDVRDARHVPASELKTLRELVRRLDPPRLVTASFGGHDLSEADLRESLDTAGLDFV